MVTRHVDSSVGAKRSVVFVVSGTRGDVQPCVVAACELRRQGVSVRIAAPTEYRAMIESAAVPFAALPENPSAFLAAHRTIFDGAFSPDALRNSVRYLRLTSLWTTRMLDAAATACADAHVVVGGLASLWAADVADACGARVLWMLLQPLTPTRAFAASIWPWRAPRAMSYRFINAALGSSLRGMVNRWRRSRGLPPLGRTFGALARIHAQEHAVMNAFSASMVPAPDDWPVTAHPLGVCLSEDVPALDAALHAWLGSGRDVMYIGAGAGSSAPMMRALPWLHEALLRHRMRAVVNLPRVPDAFRERMFAVRDVPHAALFPLMRCVVHHGGAGTTAEAARAGVPSVVAPVFADQHFWAGCAHAVGAAARPLSGRAGRSEWLECVDAALHDARLRRGAHDCAVRMRDEHGARRVVDRVMAA